MVPSWFASFLCCESIAGVRTRKIGGLMLLLVDVVTASCDAIERKPGSDSVSDPECTPFSDSVSLLSCVSFRRLQDCPSREDAMSAIAHHYGLLIECPGGEARFE